MPINEPSEAGIRALIGGVDYAGQVCKAVIVPGEQVNPCMFPGPGLIPVHGAGPWKGRMGRSVLKKHECCYVEIENEEEFSDIDTEEQIKKNSTVS